jgi:hypothetical protein
MLLQYRIQPKGKEKEKGQRVLSQDEMLKGEKKTHK